MARLEEFRYPNRKPWLLLMLLGVVALVLWMRRARREEPPQAEQAEPAAQVSALEAPVAPAPAGAGVRDAMAPARAAEAAGDLLQARQGYLDSLKASPGGRTRTDAEDGLGRVNIQLAMSPRPMPEKAEVVVERGDSLDRLAGKYGTTVDLIRIGNGIKNPNLIKVGDRLRILTGKFALTVNKSRNEMILSLNGLFFKRYRVGTGQFGKTPSGTFTISDKIKEPVWWRPDGKEIPYGHEENILGTRWMTLRATGDTPAASGYGIHGTWDNNTVGRSVSAGCIRLRNEDVEELYTLIPLGTPVTIPD